MKGDTMQDRAVITAARSEEFEPFLTAREVAERLRIAPCTVLRYFDEGVLPGRRLRRGPRRPVRFRWSEVEAALIEGDR
jgi:excisionase family DNA binding protein